MFATATPTLVRGGTAKARRFLDQLMARVGIDGLVAAMRSPELTATVHIHATEVRDSVAQDSVTVEPVALADYANEILADWMRTGGLLPIDSDEIDWQQAEWYLLRLVAVCQVADESGCL